MCGIFGFVAAQAQPFPLSLARRIDRQLLHRGPDDRGWLSLRGDAIDRGRELTSDTAAECYLLHRRLAILDLSTDAWQPMSSRDGRYHLVFNGEIYNFVELRAQLEMLGHRFRSEGDTEVLLAACAEWGRAALRRLTGMFAFALLDVRERTVLLARDPLGIKPLYHARWHGGIAFASEVGTLLELPGIGRTPNAQRAYGYLRYGDTGPGEDTFFADISQLPAAHTLELSLDRPSTPRLRRYWTLEPQITSDLSFDEAAQRTRELFTESVRLHTRSDVPIGVTLSGGIDSSSVACAAREVWAGDGELRAYSYAAQNEQISDRGWAERAARASRATMRLFTVSPQDLPADFDRLLDAYHEPGSVATNYLQMRLAACAHEAGTKVILSGQGADETFAGYPVYFTARLASLLRQGRWLQAARLVRRLQTNRQTGSLSQLLLRDAMVAPAFVQRSRLRAHSRPMPEWLNARWFYERGVRPAPPRPVGGRHVVRDWLLREVLETTLPGLLRGEDRASMAYSVELRVPFVTPELVTFALGLPEEYLVSPDGTRKAVFRHAMRGLVPDKLLDRRWKLGLALSPFESEFDVEHWLDGPVDAAATGDGPLRARSLYADRERALRREGEGDLSRLWRIATFARWAERFSVPLR